MHSSIDSSLSALTSLCTTTTRQLINKAQVCMKATPTILAKVLNIDLIKILFVVTWWYAWLGLHITKAFEFGFKLVLSMPDEWLKLPSIFNKPIFNSAGQQINILNAYSEAGLITNKMKLFMRWYWDHADGEIYDTNGFNFNKLNQLLNCSALYCSYLLTNQNVEIAPEDFWKNIKHLVVIQQPSSNVRVKPIVLRSDNLDFTDPQELLLGHVDFDNLGDDVGDNLGDDVGDNLGDANVDNKMDEPQDETANTQLEPQDNTTDARDSLVQSIISKFEKNNSN
jgi:hypothetical protein